MEAEGQIAAVFAGCCIPAPVKCTSHRVMSEVVGKEAEGLACLYGFFAGAFTLESGGWGYLWGKRACNRQATFCPLCFFSGFSQLLRSSVSSGQLRQICASHL